MPLEIFDIPSVVKCIIALYDSDKAVWFAVNKLALYERLEISVEETTNSVRPAANHLSVVLVGELAQEHLTLHLAPLDVKE